MKIIFRSVHCDPLCSAPLVAIERELFLGDSALVCAACSVPVFTPVDPPEPLIETSIRFRSKYPVDPLCVNRMYAATESQIQPASDLACTGCSLPVIPE